MYEYSNRKLLLPSFLVFLAACHHETKPAKYATIRRKKTISVICETTTYIAQNINLCETNTTEQVKHQIGQDQPSHCPNHHSDSMAGSIHHHSWIAYFGWGHTNTSAFHPYP